MGRGPCGRAPEEGAYIYIYTYVCEGAYIYIYTYVCVLEIIIDLPIGFPINNIISLYVCVSMCIWLYTSACVWVCLCTKQIHAVTVFTCRMCCIHIECIFVHMSCDRPREVVTVHP